MASRPFFPKMPVTSIVQNPRALALPAAGFGMLMRIVLHYWQTECRPLPGKSEIFTIARAQRPTWAKWRDEILETFADLRPELEKDFRQQVGRRNGMLAMGLKGTAIMQQLRAQQLAARNAAAPAAPTRPVISESARRPKEAGGAAFNEAA